MTDPERQDFVRIIAEIEAAGITAYKLRLMMHRDKKQIKRWKNGQEPRYYEGVMLLMIHSHFVPKPDKLNCGLPGCDGGLQDLSKTGEHDTSNQHGYRYLD